MRLRFWPSFGSRSESLVPLYCDSTSQTAHGQIAELAKALPLLVLSHRPAHRHYILVRDHTSAPDSSADATVDLPVSDMEKSLRKAILYLRARQALSE